MENQDFWLYVTYFFLALFWLPAYILIARRGFIEKTYGMPIVAMLGNWPWEWIYGLNLDSPCPIVWSTCPERPLQLANFASMFLDAFIVYTVFKFGRNKFSNRFIRKYYYPILIFGLISSFAIQYTFVTEVGFPNIHHLPVNGQVPLFLPGDEGGSYSAYILTFVMGVLFIHMLTERNSLEGQSFIIAMFMLLGNVACYAFLAILRELTPLLAVLFVLTLFVNIIYAVMTYQKSIELGIDPFRRW
ncbi:MAG TPA: hypothetical protein VK206_21560 [Anaerolineales bacterium]|nr:hypothetical protein [Anaerolineales bacterium]